MIIGVSAKKQGGKSTFVEFLTQGLLSWKVVRFADKLKEITIECFVPPEWHWTVDDLDSDEKKRAVLPCGKTVRQILQIVGTDQFRTLWSGCWINAYGVKVSQILASEIPPVILTPDVRFPNELRYVQSHGGKVIRLTRAPFADEHESETALDPAMWATVLEWDKHTLQESIRLAMLKNKHWINMLLIWKKAKPGFDELYDKWKEDPVLFDEVTDNQNRTLDQQKCWVYDWIERNFE